MEERKSAIDLSIIMPALNEERNIAGALEHTLEAFGVHGLEGEIIVVDDGSRDGTAKIVEDRIARDDENRIRLIRHDKPRGVGAAFRDGLRAARGEAVAFMPGDDENEPGEIMRYYGLLEHVDMVVPFVYNREVRSFSRNALSSLYRTIVNATFGVHFTYTNGTTLFRRAVLAGRENKSDGFFYQTENVIRAARAGYLYAEAPCRLSVRGGGESKALSLESFLWILKDYFRLVAEIWFSSRGPESPLAPGTVSARRRSGRD